MPGFKTPGFKTLTRYLLGTLFIIAGANHFINTDFYVSIMPPYRPWHLELVYLSGVAEAGLGTLVLFRRWAKLATWALIALMVAVFPANLHMAMNTELLSVTLGMGFMAALAAARRVDRVGLLVHAGR